MIQISKYNKQHPLRVFEAFAGYGSQSLAFKYLKEKHPEFDFKVVGYSEIESSAIQAYGLLHGRDITNYGDVTRIDWNEVPDFDFISWSSPCQDFSNAGLRQGGEEGSGTRSSLNAQEIINISKLRLCYKASYETRKIWMQVVEELRKIEPHLAAACVPQCIYRGFCPESKSCGKVDTHVFPVYRENYKHLFLIGER